MKILFMAPANDIHTCRWVNELSIKGNEVVLIYCKDHKPKLHKINSEVKHYCLKYNSGIGYYFNYLDVKKVYLKENPDVINVHYASGYGTLARIAKLPKIVLSVWGSDVYDFPYKSKLNSVIVKKNLNNAFQIASTSNAMANQVKRLITPTREITVTPFGVDTKLFSPREKEKREEIKIGIVKRLKKKYGIEYLILSYSLLIKKLKKLEKNELSENIYLDIYGDGEEKENLQKIINDNGLKNRVRLKGVIENKYVPEILKDLDIFALSSVLNSESFGVAAVEAMSVGIPVVATDVDGFKEVVDNEITGFIVSKKNVEEMSDKLLELVLNEQLRLEMGAKSREKVLEQYNFSSNVDTMISLYEKNINQRNEE